MSNLPVPVAVHVSVVALSSAVCGGKSQQLVCMYVPFGSTMPAASLMVVHPAGGLIAVQMLVVGS